MDGPVTRRGIGSSRPRLGGRPIGMALRVERVNEVGTAAIPIGLLANRGEGEPA